MNWKRRLLQEEEEEKSFFFLSLYGVLAIYRSSLFGLFEWKTQILYIISLVLYRVLGSSSFCCCVFGRPLVVPVDRLVNELLPLLLLLADGPTDREESIELTRHDRSTSVQPSIDIYIDRTLVIPHKLSLLIIKFIYLFLLLLYTGCCCCCFWLRIKCARTIFVSFWDRYTLTTLFFPIWWQQLTYETW